MSRQQTIKPPQLIPSPLLTPHSNWNQTRFLIKGTGLLVSQQNQSVPE